MPNKIKNSGLTNLIRKSEMLTFRMTAGIVDRAPWTRRARRIDSVLLPICYIWRSDEFMASKSI